MQAARVDYRGGGGGGQRRESVTVQNRRCGRAQQHFGSLTHARVHVCKFEVLRQPIHSCAKQVIGMTNRPDMIDSAITRPGRLEIKIEIGLPDARGRSQILSIHTAGMRKKKVLQPDVDLDVLTRKTKNFTGQTTRDRSVPQVRGRGLRDWVKRSENSNSPSLIRRGDRRALPLRNVIRAGARNQSERHDETPRSVQNKSWTRRFQPRAERGRDVRFRDGLNRMRMCCHFARNRARNDTGVHSVVLFFSVFR